MEDKKKQQDELRMKMMRCCRRSYYFIHRFSTLQLLVQLLSVCLCVFVCSWDDSDCNDVAATDGAGNRVTGMIG